MVGRRVFTRRLGFTKGKAFKTDSMLNTKRKVLSKNTNLIWVRNVSMGEHRVAIRWFKTFQPFYSSWTMMQPLWISVDSARTLEPVQTISHFSGLSNEIDALSACGTCFARRFCRLCTRPVDCLAIRWIVSGRYLVMNSIHQILHQRTDCRLLANIWPDAQQILRVAVCHWRLLAPYRRRWSIAARPIWPTSN